MNHLHILKALHGRLASIGLTMLSNDWGLCGRPKRVFALTTHPRKQGSRGLLEEVDALMSQVEGEAEAMQMGMVLAGEEVHQSTVEPAIMVTQGHVHKYSHSSLTSIQILLYFGL